MIYSADVVLRDLRGLLWLLMVAEVVLRRPVDVLSTQGYAKVHIYGGRRPVCTPACGCGANQWRRKPSRRSSFRCLVLGTTREWLQSDGAFFFCGCGHWYSQKFLPHHVRLAHRRCRRRTRSRALTRRHRWRAVLISWLLLIMLAVALAPTMGGWAAVVASSLDHTMQALNGNGPGKGRPSKIGKAECLVAAQK